MLLGDADAEIPQIRELLVELLVVRLPVVVRELAQPLLGARLAHGERAQGVDEGSPLVGQVQGGRAHAVRPQRASGQRTSDAATSSR